MLKCLVIQPGAYGDILVCAPIAKYYSDNGYDVYWPITNKFMSMLSRLDYVKPILLDDRTLDSDWLRSDVIKCTELINNKIIEPDLILNLAERGGYNVFPLTYGNFEQRKYEYASVPFEYKNTLKWTRNIEKENSLYELLVDDENYIFAHLESSRGDVAKLPDRILDEKIKVISCEVLDNYNIYDWYKVIINAKEIYCVESSIHQFIDGFSNDIKHIPKYILSRATLSKGQTYTISKNWDKKYVN